MSMQKAQADLDEALQYKQQLIDKYCNEPDTLKFYLPSAEWIVDMFTKKLDVLKGQELE